VTSEYDPSTPHGTIRWRSHEGIPVIEIVNNWEFERFEETYSSPRLNRQLAHVLDATRPDVLHVHNLLNLSFDLPRLARERGIPSVATLHDYTLVCASGGQRVHAAESHVCKVIDTDRCSRCFADSPFHAQLVAGQFTRRGVGARIVKAAAEVRRLIPSMGATAARYVPAPRITGADMQRRLAYARHVFDQVDLFVAPSAALADEYARLGLDERRIQVSDYGFVHARPVDRITPRPLTFGFVGTLVWHKGAHVLMSAVGRLNGDFQVNVFGDPAVSPRYSSELRRLADGLPVRFLGPFARDGVAGAYASIDVLVVPSLWPENSPLVIHEAFMHGAAVVAARTGGIPGLVTDGVNGFLYDPFRSDDLGDRLQRFVDDPPLAGRLAACAPAIKGMEDDAGEWERRYGSLIAVPA
jgi:glycosyltransferase involved in cell wall biosynthesis